MLRHIIIVLLGVLLGYLATAASGYLLYSMERSAGWSEPQLGKLARSALDPLIAILVGLFVGGLAKRAAGVLATLSLVVWMIPILRSKPLSSSHGLLLIILGCFYVVLGAVAAEGVFCRRTRARATA